MMGSSRARSQRLLVASITLLLGGCPDPPSQASGSSGSSDTGDATGPAPVTGTSGAPSSTGVVDDTGVSSSSSGSGSDTGQSQSCCEPHRGPGCDDPELAACVCEDEAFCCAFDWDARCVELTAQCGGCGAATDTDTTGGPPACCEDADQPGCADDPVLEACVCALDEYCCDTQWDDVCVQTGIRQCGAACGMGGSETCCAPSGAPGCPEDPAVEACVCARDSFCCDTQWDGMCVQVAQDDCGLACPSGGDCCSPHGLPGCDDVAINDCVCALDGYCCNNEWDGLCVNEAQYACMAPCGLPPANMGDCCTDQPGPGCDDVLVSDCTCQSDYECCLFPWDDHCIGLAVSVCALECEGVVPLDPCCFEQPGPGCLGAPVEACVCALDEYCCDTQWDYLCVEQAQEDCMLDCGGGGGSETGGSETGGSSSTG